MEYDHTFAVCAYGKSPYLGECIASLKNQVMATNIIICTSTPNEYVDSIAKAEGVPVYESGNEPGIASDWNYALSCANTQLVTIAHQDDVYCPEFSLRVIREAAEVVDPIIFFTDYCELRAEGLVSSNELLETKRKMLSLLVSEDRRSSVFWRRCILRFGSPICCPSVTYNKSVLPLPLFQDNMRCSLDWQAWERLSRIRGSFCYLPEALMYHRIHEDSETTHLIEDNTRMREDLAMLKCFWPSPLARLINWFYAKSQDSNG